MDFFYDLLFARICRINALKLKINVLKSDIIWYVVCFDFICND